MLELILFRLYILFGMSNFSLSLNLFAKILSIDGNFYILFAISKAAIYPLHRSCLFDGGGDRVPSVMVR